MSNLSNTLIFIYFNFYELDILLILEQEIQSIQYTKTKTWIATKTPKPETRSTNKTYQKDKVNMYINSTILDDGFES